MSSSSVTIYLGYRWYPLSRVFLESSVVNSEQKSLEFHPSWSLLGHSLGLSLIAILSMAYKVLLVVLAILPNGLLVLPPKNGWTHFVCSFQGFWSISLGLIWSSRFKIMVNSNLKLLQLRFMIYQLWLIYTSCGHTWCDYGQNHLTPLSNSIRLWQILGIIYYRHTSSNFQYF
jgi:hypothetical protein